jgi:uncharacterized protein (TIGR00251 family)
VTARAESGAVAFDVLVTPRASRERIGPMVGDRLKVAVTAPPVEGEANAAVIACVARGLGVAKSSVTIARGDGSRRKTVRVTGLTLERVTAWLEGVAKSGA